MTIEEIEALIQGYLAPNDVDSEEYLRGRSEGHADIACALAKALHCEKEKLSLIGLLRRARNLQEAVMDQLGQIMLLSRRVEGEPSPLDAIPIFDAYAAERISGGKARELLLLWLRGAGREELAAHIPDEEPEEVRNERERLLRKLEKIENLSKHAWEQVDKNPAEAKELFRMIYAVSK